jgi:aryl-alcohol dehydrogenase-like predicted oxidoreductase
VAILHRVTLSALGETEVLVSRVGLGGFELGPDEGEEPDVGIAVGVLQASIDAGVNWVDTTALRCTPRAERACVDSAGT